MTVVMSLLTAFFVALMSLTQVLIGALALVLIGTLTGGRWFEAAGPALRRTLAAFPFAALCFLPFLWYLPHVHVESSGPFLNPIAFDARAIFYWLLWLGWARAFQSSRSRVAAGLGLLMLLFTITFAAMDWIMFLDREWISSGFGIIFISDALIAGIAFMIRISPTRKPQAAPIGDYANLLLMASLFWIYMHYMEYLVIWQGQIPHEMRWYEVRFSSPYLVVVWAVLALTFLVPFPALLFKKLKLNVAFLRALALMALIARPLELHELISPTQALSPWPTLFVALVLSAAALKWLSKKASDDV